MSGSSSSPREIKLNVDFGGGLDVLFNKQPRHTITLNVNDNDNDAESSAASPVDSTPSSKPSNKDALSSNPNVTALITHLKDNVLTDKNRADLFADDRTLRPGILVLINDADWELEGEGNYVLQDGDCVSFISTLHGG